MKDFNELVRDLGLESEFKEIPKVSVVGSFQNGKSTFINCILDDFIASIGNGVATTKISTRYRWGEQKTLNTRSGDGKLHSISQSDYLNGKIDYLQSVKNTAFQAEIKLPRKILKKISLIDTPGFNASEEDDENVMRSLEEVDYAIIILTNQHTPTQNERLMLNYIAEKGIPYAIIMNCKDANGFARWHPESNGNKNVIQETASYIKSNGYQPDRIDDENLLYPCNLLWYWTTRGAYKKSNNLYSNSKSIRDKINFSFSLVDINNSDQDLIRESRFLPIKSFFENRLAELQV